tara:strand:+ start:36 stop:254 length:219 start_codon:yes stop_codon:yes gene_type:complete
VNKLATLLIILLLTASCSEESKIEKYFANCVNDGMKARGLKERDAINQCSTEKTYFNDKFTYYKGKIFSKKR